MEGECDFKCIFPPFPKHTPTGRSMIVRVSLLCCALETPSFVYRCQNDDGSCPPDASSDATPVAISSPFDVFSGQCETNAEGFFQVCVYICAETKIVTWYCLFLCS